MKPQDDTKFVPGNKNDIGGRKEKTPIDADGIKIAAGAVAGVAIGGGAAYAASEFLGGDAVEDCRVVRTGNGENDAEV